MRYINNFTIKWKSLTILHFSWQYPWNADALCHITGVHLLRVIAAITYAIKMPNNCVVIHMKKCACCSPPMVQFLFIFKHPKRFHSITEFLGVLVVYFTWGCKANGRGDAIMFLRLLPARHSAVRKTWHENKAPVREMTATAQHLALLR